MKYCGKCRVNKEMGYFNKNKARKDGLQRYCRECSKKYDVNYFQSNKERVTKKRNEVRRILREEVNKYKTDKGCQACGAVDVAFLDFHHVEEKVENVSIMLSNNPCRETVFKEIEKCIVLCSNCHRKLHYYNLTLEELKEYNTVL